jgi:hypothetical protein
MNNVKYNQIIDEAYNNWCKQFEVDPNNFNGEEVAKGHNDQCWGYPILDHVKSTSKEYKRGQINAYLEGKAERPFFYLTQEEFIYKIKTDQEFSERWGLKIEERELSRLERICIAIEKKLTHKTAHLTKDFDYQKWCDEQNIPIKLITLTYNNETIEVYE